MKHPLTILVVTFCLAGLAWADPMTMFSNSQSPAGGWNTLPPAYGNGAGDGLIIWAALSNNVPPQSPWLMRATDYLKHTLLKTTFSRAMRIMAIAADPAVTDKTLIADDAKWLYDSQSTDGGWGVKPDSPTDKLNTLDTAWAIMALDRATKCGVSVSPAIFRRAINFFQQAMNPDGGYGYDWPKARPDRLRGQSHALTTAAAIVALEIIEKHLDSDDAYLPQNLSQKALMWLSGKESPMKIDGWYWGSQPLGQYRFFLARATVDKQAVTDAIHAIQAKDKTAPANGLAEDKLVATAWALLTLAENTQKPAQPHSAQKSAAPSVHMITQDILKKIPIAAWSPKNNNHAPQAAKVLTDELRDSYSLGVDCEILSSLDELESKDPRMLWMTGCDELITTRQQSAMLRFIAAGGVVLVDVQNDAEYESAEKAFRKMYGDDAFKPISADSPLAIGSFSGGIGIDLADKLKSIKDLSRPMLMSVNHKGRTVAIFTAVPLAKTTSGDFLQDPPIQPTIAKQFLLNIILFADTQEVNP